ncbi:MAG: flippase [Paludibacteraceae bacterium]|nr:flippase [Paludibacteraceae bacterium]
MVDGENKRVIKNAAWMTVFQAANYVIPILLIPYVSRILGVDSFGKVTYMQTIAQYATFFINFGFEYTSTRAIAVNRDNPEKLRSIFWGTIYAKMLLTVVSLLVFFPYSFNHSQSTEEMVMYMAAWMINVGWWLYPSWYFQGMEKLSIMSVANFMIKAAGAILVVVCVREASDSVNYLASFSFSYIAGGLITIVYCVRTEGMRRISVTVDTVKTLLGDSLPVFLASVFSSITQAYAITYLGSGHATEHDLGIYSGAFKLVFAAVAMCNLPISMAIFPKVSREYEKDREGGIRYFYKTLKIVVLIAFCFSVGMYVFSPLAVTLLLGDKFEESTELLRYYSICPLLCTTSLYLTVQGLYAVQRQKYATIVEAIALVVCIVSTIFLNEQFGVRGAVWAFDLTVLTEIVLSFSVILMMNRKK